MINLLPPQRLLDIRIARNNTVLRRYIELVVMSLALLAVAVAAAYNFLHSQQQDTREAANANRQKVEELKPVQEDAEQLSATVNTISGILSRNREFSVILTQIGSLMPSGSVLTGLDFSIEDLTSPLVVSAQVENEERAAVLRNNLANSPLFSRAEIKTISQIEEEEVAPSADPAASSPPASPYRYTTIINAYFKETGAKQP